MINFYFVLQQQPTIWQISDHCDPLLHWRSVCIAFRAARWNVWLCKLFKMCQTPKTLNCSNCCTYKRSISMGHIYWQQEEEEWTKQKKKINLTPFLELLCLFLKVRCVIWIMLKSNEIKMKNEKWKLLYFVFKQTIFVCC